MLMNFGHSLGLKVIIPFDSFRDPIRFPNKASATNETRPVHSIVQNPKTIQVLYIKKLNPVTKPKMMSAINAILPSFILLVFILFPTLSSGFSGCAC
jgi:hypothetical protein